MAKELLMANAGRSDRVYTVVDVWRGVAVGAYNFRSLRAARVALRRIRRGRNLQEDDVQLFEGTIYSGKRKTRKIMELPSSSVIP